MELHSYLLVNCTNDTNSYLDDHDATLAAFTSDGFFKTGDYAYCVDNEYVIEGRISTDCQYIYIVQQKAFTNFR